VHARSTIYTLPRTKAGYVNYSDEDSDWWLLEMTTTTDHNHWEQLSTVSFLNLLVSTHWN
jgi:hypothetical protein